MKDSILRGLLFGALLLGLTATPGRAQLFGSNYSGMTVNGQLRRVDTIPYRFNVALMPLSFLGQGLELAGELLVGPKTSVRLQGGYFLGTRPSFYSGSEDFSGWRGELQLRFFLSEIARERQSYYLGPFFQVKHIELEKIEDDPQNPWLTLIRKREVTAPSFGVLAGYQYVLPQGFLFDVFLGGGLIIPNDRAAAREVHLDLVNPYNRGVMIRGGIGLGLAR